MAVRQELEDAVMWITLDRPDRLNAIDLEMQRELRAALEAAAQPEVRCVVLTGAGRAFCVGQDLDEFQGMSENAEELVREHYNPNVLALRSLEKPVIAGINGVAAGAGMAFALACDVRICSSAAALVPAFNGVALVPDSGASLFLTNLIGANRAFTWLASGATTTAVRAREQGLVDEVVEPDALGPRVAAVAAGFASGPTLAYGLTKRLLRRASEPDLAAQLEAEAVLQGEAARSADHREGVAAFLEKRAAEFQGR